MIITTIIHLITMTIMVLDYDDDDDVESFAEDFLIQDCEDHFEDEPVANICTITVYYKFLLFIEY